LRLDDLQKIPFQELLDKASEVGVENPGGMLKYELILKFYIGTRWTMVV